MFDRKRFEAACAAACGEYEKAAPTVAEWADWLYQAKDQDVTLADLHILGRIVTENPGGNLAANMIYHHQTRLGRDTIGQSGF
jgi:hypothetical protein